MIKELIKVIKEAIACRRAGIPWSEIRNATVDPPESWK